MFMNEQLKQQQSQINHLQQVKIIIPQKQVIQSQSYLDQIYQQSSKHITKQSLIKELQKSNIVYSEQSYYQTIQIKLFTHTLNYQACSIVVYYGHFSTQMKIINVDCNSPTLKMQSIGKGKSAQVYQYSDKDQQHAIKVRKYQNDEIQLLKQIIKEYFLSLMASILGIGPKITNICGFDIAIYRNTIQYSMKLCQKINSILPSHLQGLKQKLFKLHLLKIVHSDIKPQNISFDEQKQQLLLIDFGLSKFIKEERCSKTLVRQFNGSFNFCTKQMQNIFVLKQSHYINLYQNDCFGLLKTLNQLLMANQNNQRSEQLMIFQGFQFYNFDTKMQNLKYKQQLQQKLANIIKKYNLFLTLIYPFLPNLSNKTEKYIYSILRQQYYHQFHFLRQLPFNSFALQYFQYTERIPICQLLSQFKIQNRQFKKLMDFNNWQIDTFKRRIKQLENSQTTQLNLYLNQNKPGQFLLFNPTTIAETEKQHYYLILCKFIKINGQSKSMKHTIRCLKNMKQLSQKLDTSSQEQLYYAAMKILLEFCQQPSFSDKKYVILINIIQTLIMLQIIDQNSIKSLFINIIGHEISEFKKIRLCFQVISSFQYIRHKYKSTYNYKKLKSFCINQLLQYLNACSSSYILKQKNVLLYKAISLALSYRIDMSVHYQQIIKEAQKLYALSLQQRKFIVSQLNLYIAYNQLMVDLSNCTLNNTNRFFILQQKILMNMHYSIFSYHFYVLFMFYYYLNWYQKNQYIYEIFIRRIGSFKQHLSFKIRIYYQLQKIIGKLYLQNVGTFFNGTRKHSNNNIIEELQHISGLVIQHKIEFKQFLYDLMLLLNFKKYNQYTYLLIKIITDNKQHIMFCPEQQIISQNTIHDNLFIKQVRNIQLLISYGQFYSIFTKQQSQILYSLFYQKSQLKLNEINCLQCKISSIMQSKIFYMSNFSAQNYKIVVQMIIDFIVLCYKHKQLKQYEPQIMLKLVRISFKYNYLLNEVLLFFYKWMNMRSEYLYILKNQSQKEIFIYLYKFILRSFSQLELAQFIIMISYYIQLNYSFAQVNQFYSNILDMVKRYKLNSKYFRPFVQDHYSIMNNMLRQRPCDPYLSIYYIALLQCKIKSPMANKALLVISKNMNNLYFHAKYLIFSRYYYFCNFYFNKPSRKQKYLQKMILKYKTNIKKETKFKFLKMKKNKVEKHDRIHYKTIMHCLNKYYVKFKDKA